MKTGSISAMIFLAVGGLAICAAQGAPPAATQAPAPQASQTSTGQATPQATTPSSAASPAQTPSTEGKNAKPSTSGQRRRAAKLYLEAAKLYEQGRFEEALRNNEQAARLDPTSENYRLAAEVARSHAVTALMQTAAKDRTQGDLAGARAALTHAIEIDPHSPEVEQHLRELDPDSESGTFEDEASSEKERLVQGLGSAEQIEPAAGVHSFHTRGSQRQIIQDVFKAYGIQATIDDSVRENVVRLDVDDASFEDATRALAPLTNSFYVPIDAHRVLVALDTREYRTQFTRNAVETVYLAGLTPAEMTDIGNMAKNVFEVPQSAVDPTSGTLTLRAPQSSLNAFNATFRSLMDGRNQVLLDVRIIQLAHNNTRNTGVTPPQQVTAFNVFSEEQQILNANQALVQQIISSGLAAPGDTLKILAILIASGAVSNSLFQNGILLFGGGISLTGISPQPFTANLNLNSSDSRELDNFQLRLGDGEDGTLKSGTRYPIETSSFSSLGTSGLNIPGLTSAGTSSSLNSILSSLNGASTTIPQVQYEDLGLVLKATPSVMRSGDVALKIDMKISALAGSSVNGVPVLANRAWTGVVTVPQNQAVVVVSEMDKQESRAVSGTPGLSEIPGLNNITNKDVQQNYATLLIILTPHVVRSPRNAEHTPMFKMDKTLLTR